MARNRRSSEPRGRAARQELGRTRQTTFDEVTKMAEDDPRRQVLLALGSQAAVATETLSLGELATRRPLDD
jgi:hypothetical protein